MKSKPGLSKQSLQLALDAAENAAEIAVHLNCETEEYVDAHQRLRGAYAIADTVPTFTAKCAVELAKRARYGLWEEVNFECLCERAAAAILKWNGETPAKLVAEVIWLEKESDKAQLAARE
jgi:hypothetical protein